MDEAAGGREKCEDNERGHMGEISSFPLGIREMDVHITLSISYSCHGYQC